MLCGFFTALYQLVLFVFYFFYFLFKGKPEWQKNGEHRCTAGTVCCMHSAPTTIEDTTTVSSNEAVSKQSSTTTNEIVNRTLKETCKLKKTQQNKNDASGATQHVPSQPYKITVNFKGVSGCSHATKQHSKFAVGVNKISESVKRLITTPYHYLVNALVSTKESVYSIAGGIRNIFLWKRSSTPSNEQFVQKSLQQEEKSLAEQVTEAFAQQNANVHRHETCDIVKTFISETGAPFSEFTESAIEKHTIIPHPLKGSAEFYARTEAFRDGLETETTADASGASFVPPPSPPPTFGVAPTGVTAQLESTTPALEKMPKGAVAVLPPDLMAEASARIRELDLKLNETNTDRFEAKRASPVATSTAEPASTMPQNEISASDWAVSNRRFLPHWTGSAETTLTHRSHASRGHGITESEDETEVSWRPHGRKVVSRIPKAKDENAQFIFSAAKQPEYIPQSSLPDGGFYMGRSVFSPVQEAEEMRPAINRRASATPSESHLGSRINTPFEELLPQSRINTSLESTPYNYSRSQSRFADAFSPSRSRSQSRFGYGFPKIPVRQEQSYYRQSDNRTRHRSHTVEPKHENMVQAISRRWPPESNATGVEFTKDNWNVIPSSVTSCRKVMERTVTDKWTTRDESGAVVNQWAERSWHGESSGLQRHSDGTGETWRRAVEVNPQGRTSFYDNRRLYAPDYVVESETRNV